MSKLTKDRNPWPVSVTGSSVVAAGKATNGDTTDRTIATAGFGHIAIVNEGPDELRIAIDADSTSAPQVIYVAANEAYDDAVAGSDLHYSTASGTATFRYVLRA